MAHHHINLKVKLTMIQVNDTCIDTSRNALEGARKISNSFFIPFSISVQTDVEQGVESFFRI